MRWPSGREVDRARIRRGHPTAAPSPSRRDSTVRASTLYLVDARGGAPRRVTTRPGDERWPPGPPTGVWSSRRAPPINGTSSRRARRWPVARRRHDAARTAHPCRTPTRPSRACRRTAGSWSSSRPATRRTARAISGSSSSPAASSPAPPAGAARAPAAAAGTPAPNGRRRGRRTAHASHTAPRSATRAGFASSMLTSPPTWPSTRPDRPTPARRGLGLEARRTGRCRRTAARSWSPISPIARRLQRAAAARPPIRRRRRVPSVMDRGARFIPAPSPADAVVRPLPRDRRRDAGASGRDLRRCMGGAGAALLRGEPTASAWRTARDRHRPTAAAAADDAALEDAVDCARRRSAAVRPPARARAASSSRRIRSRPKRVPPCSAPGNAIDAAIAGVVSRSVSSSPRLRDRRRRHGLVWRAGAEAPIVVDFRIRCRRRPRSTPRGLP